MKKAIFNKFIKELIWFVGIIGIAALVEFAIIEAFDLHPVLSIKIQGLLGLMVLGYGFRMSVRLWKAFNPRPDSVDANERKNGE